MKSVSIGALGSLTLTRRTATVTISAPDAATAAAFCAKSLYLPVPTIRREQKGRPATAQVSSTSPPPTKCTISSTSASAMAIALSVDRGTISPLRSTATLAGSSSRLRTRSAIEPGAARRVSPLMVRVSDAAVWLDMAPGFSARYGPRKPSAGSAQVHNVCAGDKQHAADRQQRFAGAVTACNRGGHKCKAYGA